MAGRALVDGHAVGLGKTGNETWARNVLLELEGSAHASQFVHLLTAEGLAALAGRVDPRRVRRVSRSSLVRLTIDLPRTLRELRPEALLVQYTRPLMTRVPTVVAVHDLSFHDARAAEWIPAATLLRYRRSVDASVRRAKRVITPSEHARSAVQQHYGLSGDQVLVAPLAVDPDFLLSLAAAERHQPADHSGS